MKVLKLALDNKRYDLAAHALVFAYLKVSKNGSGKKKKPQTK